MHLDFLLERFGRDPDAEAIVWRERSFSYGWLKERVERLEALARERGVPEGAVVSLTGDFTPTSIALFLALADRGLLVSPVLRSAAPAHRQAVREIAQLEWELAVDDEDEPHLEPTGQEARHELYSRLRDAGRPGLVLFSSGSSGHPKAAVHDLGLLLEKFREPRPALKILNFLLFDHWGGLNTMLHTLSTGGTVFTVQDRSPEGICRAIERHRVQVLPASPTFLNLLLISQAYRKHDLSSLEVISYGTEPMPEATLRRLGEVFPAVKLHQTYGLIELGVLRSKSRSSDSLWVKIGGEGYQTRVVDGLLQIKARSAMLGYLNAPSPFTEDGWFMTGDAVEVDGEYLRILGRKSELINVGGEKVYPQEVENVIQETPNVRDVLVYGERNPITGHIVCADVSLVDTSEDPKQAALRIKELCRARLQPFKVPVKVRVLDETLHGERFKKLRARERDAG